MKMGKEGKVWKVVFSLKTMFHQKSFFHHNKVFTKNHIFTKIMFFLHCINFLNTRFFQKRFSRFPCDLLRIRSFSFLSQISFPSIKFIFTCLERLFWVLWVIISFSFYFTYEPLQASAPILVSQRWTNWCSLVWKCFWINFGIQSKLRRTAFRNS